MDYDNLLQMAEEAIEHLDEGCVFRLRDLYVGTYWNSLKTGERLSLGQRFKNCVRRGNIANVIYIGKAENNSALYKKVVSNI